VSAKVRVNFLLDFGNFINVFNRHSASRDVARLCASLLERGGLLNEPAGWGRLDDKFEGSVDVGCELNSHWDVLVVGTSTFVELLAKLHHVDSQRTESLTNLWGGLCGSGSAVDPDYCFLGWSRVH